MLPQYGIHDKIGQPLALDGAPQPQQQQQPTGVSANGFYGAKQDGGYKQEPEQKSLPTRTTNSSSYGNIYPIEALSPYAHKWTIKARCTSKGEIKTWHNKNGEGKLFSVNFLDESGEIRATGFNEQCDMLYDVFKEGSVYYISSPCRVTLAKKQFSQLNNDYELHFERDTLVEKVESADQSSVPKVRYNFTNLADISSVDKDTVIDVIGVIKEVGEVSQITSKTTSKPYDKREITLVDNSNFSIRLTLWGGTASKFDGAPDTVVACKGVKVSDFGGRSLSLLNSGSMALTPDIDESYKLQGWYDAQGKDDNFATHAATMGTVATSGGKKQEYKTIAAITEENIGMSDEAEYYTLKATVIYVKQDTFCYPACQTEGCNKKVVETNPDEWRCEKCDKAWPKPIYRYVMSVNVSDHTGQMWISCFDEAGRLITGTSADDLMGLKNDDEKAFSEKMVDATGRAWVFRCRAKMDNFQDQQRFVFPARARRRPPLTIWPQGTTSSIKRFAARLPNGVRETSGYDQAIQSAGRWAISQLNLPILYVANLMTSERQRRYFCYQHIRLDEASCPAT